MENASKALLIAGGILIGLIIISAGVVLYVNLNSNAEDYQSKAEIVKLQSFNAEFEKYQGRTDVIPQEIISIYNYIVQNKGKVPLSVALTVTGDSRYPRRGRFASEEAKIEYIKGNNNKYKLVNIEYNNGQVIAIKFQIV